MKTQDHLMKQDVNTDASKLTALSPEVVSTVEYRRMGSWDGRHGLLRHLWSMLVCLTD